MKDFTYEEEMRLFTNGNKYINIKVKEIIAGREMTGEEISLLKNWFRKQIPKLKL